MTHSRPPAAIPVTTSLLDQLLADSRISSAAHQEGLHRIQEQQKWLAWTMRLSGALGLALLLTGIVFFFAYNWQDIPRLYKLGILQSALALCLGASAWLRLQTLTAKYLLLAAATLTGIVLAVSGQIYQTGADSYLLFAGWAALIFPWVLLGCFAPLWALWLALVNIGAGLFADQVLMVPDQEFPTVMMLLAMLNGTALFVREYACTAFSLPWLQGRWVRLVLLLTVFIPMMVPVLLFIVDAKSMPISAVIAVAAFCVYLSGFIYLYRFKFKDISAYFLIILYLGIVLEALFIRGLDHINLPDYASYLLTGVFTLALFSGLIRILSSVARKMEHQYAG